METLVVAHHRNHHQYYSRNRGYKKFVLIACKKCPSGNFRGINCRTFQSGEGLLPTPSKARSTKTPLTETTFSTSFSPKTPSPSCNESQKMSKGIAKSSTIAIPIKFKIEKNEGDFDFPERWAGPAYSNSPPPSSLPIPKFSLRPKRTVSLDLPTVTSEFNLHPIAKSAPASPTRERCLSPCDPFDITDSLTDTSLSPCDPFDISDCATEKSLSPFDPFDISDYATEKSLSPCDSFDISVSATMTLRRILNLDDTDE